MSRTTIGARLQRALRGTASGMAVTCGLAGALAGALACATTRTAPPPEVPALGSPDGYVRTNPMAPTYALVNGRWWRDGRFESRTMYAEGGLLRDGAPSQVDSTIDLAGRWVIPPFADAHSHNLAFAAPRQDSVRDAYVREGTYYVQVLGDRASRAFAVAPQFGRPCTLDVTYSHGVVISAGAHDAEARFAIEARRSEADDAYFLVDSATDLARGWPLLLAASPDVVQIMIGGTGDATSSAARMGLSPEMARAVVRQAHAAGLRVVAEVETSRDFSVAVDVGVDVIANLGAPDFAPADARLYMIDDATARRAAARGIVVIPTVALSAALLGEDAVRLDAVQAVQRGNLTRLVRRGVRIAIGRDEPWQTARGEVEVLRSLHVLSDTALLRAWAEETPRAIYPGRRIGRLDDGYEASFIALDRDPLGGLDTVRGVALGMKQGCLTR
jgi:imidazolonepropionase-like amidohydrolase